jgi:hypothetical protein
MYIEGILPLFLYKPISKQGFGQTMHWTLVKILLGGNLYDIQDISSIYDSFQLKYNWKVYLDEILNILLIFAE